MSAPTASVDAYHTKDALNFLQDAFEFFNGALFAGRLPEAMVILHRKRGARGYFAPKSWTVRDRNGKRLEGDGGRLHEVAICPDACAGRTDIDVLSTLVHEMAHLWQERYGKPSRGGYHNGQWVEEMKRIGLDPWSMSTGDKGTGNQVTHKIRAGGFFETAAIKFLGQHTGRLGFEALVPEKKPKAAKSKVKFQCPDCDMAAWAKPTAELACGVCMVAMDKEDEEGDEA